MQLTRKVVSRTITAVSLSLCSANVLLCTLPKIAEAQTLPLVTPTSPALDPASPVAVATPPVQPPSIAALSPAYHIAPGDALEVSVLGQTELTKMLNVLPEGMITYPYVGQVKVTGMTIGELQSLITARLSKELDNPQVSVSLRGRLARAVSVIGAVKSPGKRVLGDNWRVLDLIVESGGLAVERPEWTTTTLVREGGAKTMTINLARLMATGDFKENRLLEEGDILLIQEVDQTRTQVKVVGEVVKSGMVTAPSDGSLIAALTAAGGPTKSAALAKAAILRDGQAIPVDLSVPGADGSAEKGTKLKPGDTLVIPENKATFSVMGAVARSGTQYYPEKGKLTVLGALTMAGGVNGAAELRSATIVHPVEGGEPITTTINLESMLRNKNKDKSKDKNVTTNLTLEPGDVLFVPQKEERGQHGLQLRDILNTLPLINMFRYF